MLFSQNNNTLPMHSQPKSVSSQSKINWAKVAKYIALVGGAFVAGYSLCLLQGCSSETPPSSKISTCLSAGKSAIEFLNGTTCCVGDSNCNGSGEGTLIQPHVPFSVYIQPGNVVNGIVFSQETRTYYNGDSYTGGVANGLLHGQGIYTWANGDSYTGAFVNGVRTGQGTFTWKDGVFFTGDFLNSRFHGNGTLTLLDGSTCKREYVNDYLISEVCNGDKGT